jgi:anti-sigma B factor antagonist
MQAAADPHPPAPGADSQAAAATLALGPELTIAQAALCRDQLLDALCATPGDLALDLSAVTDIDSAGIQLLLATRKSVGARGGRLHLGSPGPAVASALQAFGLDTELNSCDLGDLA